MKKSDIKSFKTTGKLAVDVSWSTWEYIDHIKTLVLPRLHPDKWYFKRIDKRVYFVGEI